MHDLPGIYLLNYHFSHPLPGSGCQTHKWGICNPNRVIVPVLVAPEDYFGIGIRFDNDIARASRFLRWDLPLPIGRLFIAAFSPRPFTRAYVNAPQSPGLSTVRGC